MFKLSISLITICTLLVLCFAPCFTASVNGYVGDPDYIIANDERVQATGYRVIDNSIHLVGFGDKRCSKILGAMVSSHPLSRCSLFTHSDYDQGLYHMHINKDEYGFHKGRVLACTFTGEGMRERCEESAKDVENSDCLRNGKVKLLKDISGTAAAGFKIGMCSSFHEDHAYAEDYTG